MKVHLIVDGHGKGGLYFGNQKVENVLAVELFVGAGEANNMVVTLSPAEVEVEFDTGEPK